MGIFGGRDRSERRSGCDWSFKSVKDPRFTGGGTSGGVWSAQFDIDAAIKALETKYGCKAPDDIETQGMKD